jgi:hypothetical protein
MAETVQVVKMVVAVDPLNDPTRHDTFQKRYE